MPAKKKLDITTRASSPRAFSPLIAELRGLILSARRAAASTINMDEKAAYSVAALAAEVDQ
jgi:hypothetical protein